MVVGRSCYASSSNLNVFAGFCLQSNTRYTLISFDSIFLVNRILWSICRELGEDFLFGLFELWCADRGDERLGFLGAA